MTKFEVVKCDGILMGANEESQKILAALGDGVIGECSVNENTARQRTIQQNKSLHKYYGLLAEELNGAGYDMRKTLEHKASIPWNPATVKEFMWKPIQKVVLETETTTKLTTSTITEIYDILNRYTSEKLGVSISWPSYQ